MIFLGFSHIASVFDLIDLLFPFLPLLVRLTIASNLGLGCFVSDLRIWFPVLGLFELGRNNIVAKPVHLSQDKLINKRGIDVKKQIDDTVANSLKVKNSKTNVPT